MPETGSSWGLGRTVQDAVHKHCSAWRRQQNPLKSHNNKINSQEKMCIYNNVARTKSDIPLQSGQWGSNGHASCPVIREHSADDMKDLSFKEQFEGGCVADFVEILIKMERNMWEFEAVDVA